MIQKLSFAHLPTPVEPLERLSTLLGGPKLFIKRDDQTGLAFGGNKTRKLEFLLAAAKKSGARTLITAGAIQSNHCRQTAAAAARFGFECILVLVGDSPEHPSGNVLLDKLLGAEFIWTTQALRDQKLKQAFEDSQANDRVPYLIPYGGSNPTGAVAYTYAIEELIKQQIDPDWIVFATSSGGTQAGMIVGKHHFGLRGEILGISVDEPASILQDRISDLSGETASLLGDQLVVQNEQIQVNTDYLGGGYAQMGEPELEAIQLFAQYEGILLDPVYTGRAAAGMIDLIRKGFLKPRDRVLFWHTGGMPALFADRYRDVLNQV